MTPGHDHIVEAYLSYLRQLRSDASFEDDAWEQFDEIAGRQPKAAFSIAVEIVSRADEDDLSLIGTALLASLLARHPGVVAAEFETALRSNDRFLRAFQYAAMTGVPLETQRRLNAAMLDRGVDPKFVVEYEESEEEA